MVRAAREGLARYWCKTAGAFFFFFFGQTLKLQARAWILYPWFQDGRVHSQRAEGAMSTEALRNDNGNGEIERNIGELRSRHKQNIKVKKKYSFCI